jgi:hypothetical protein
MLTLAQGRFKYQFARTEKEGNPWRVTYIKAMPVQTGAANVYEGSL